MPFFWSVILGAYVSRNRHSFTFNENFDGCWNLGQKRLKSIFRRKCLSWRKLPLWIWILGAGISRGAFHQNVIGRSQDKFARLPTSRVLRATPTKIQHPRETFRLQKLYPLQICFFFALSAPRTFGKPNSVFKNISASIVLVRERTFYCRPYNVLKVTRFCHAYVFPGVVVL